MSYPRGIIVPTKGNDMIAVVTYNEDYPTNALGYYIAPDAAVDEIINTNDINEYMWDKSPRWEHKIVRVYDEGGWETEWTKLKNKYDYVFVMPPTDEWEESGEYPMLRDVYYYHNGKRHVA